MTCGCNVHCSNRCPVECCGVNAPWCPCACHARAYALRRPPAFKPKKKARAKYLTDGSQRPRVTMEPSFEADMRERFPGKPMRELEGMWMTLHAALVATGAGRSPLTDVALIRSGDHTRESLFRECLQQSDPRTRQHWSEYTFAIERYAHSPQG
jgi:hypothetical protein